MFPAAGRRSLPTGAEIPWALRRHDGSLLRPGTGPALMAVLNLTPDSFSDGGLYADASRAEGRIDELVAAGADVIDLGAESTRPGAESLSVAEEWGRLAPLFRRIERRQLGVALSIDTRHAEVARRAAEHGVALLNLPTVACVTGHAYGGGALLASACDFRTMRADRGFFCFPEVDIKLAFTPAMLASVNLLRNEQLRWEMALTGRPVGGEEAAKKGIVDAAFGADDLLPKTLALAAQLAGKDRRTYTQIKRMMRQHLQPLIDDSKR